MSAYITEMQRYKIEFLLKQKVQVKEIALEIGKHYTTVYREIKSGTIELKNSDLTTRKEYCADYAQRVHDDAGHNKGREIKLGNDFKTAEKIETLIKKEKYSPYAVSCVLRKEGLTYLCAATIYTYIDHGYINLTNFDLPHGKESRKDKEKETIRRPALHNLGARSIEERPKEIYNRDKYGHWEMDTVYSGKGKGKECLLVLTERKTREEIIRKMPDRTKESTVAVLDNIEKELGTPEFCRKFKSITIDNGVEFYDYKGIERSLFVDGRRTTAYFCHPFCSSERGSNENQNKLVRRHIKKGENIGKYTDEEIKLIEEWINNYPRKLFNGLSVNDYKALLDTA